MSESSNTLLGFRSLWMILRRESSCKYEMPRAIPLMMLRRCGPRISCSCAFPTRWQARFLFENLIFIDYLKMTWSHHLFLFYF